MFGDRRIDLHAADRIGRELERRSVAIHAIVVATMRVVMAVAVRRFCRHRFYSPGP
jgi:hypothetical protein